jgi:Bacterial PH domain
MVPMTTINATFDKQEQYDKIAAGLLPGETIVAVYDAIGSGTGFIGVTNLRVVLQDNSFVGKKIALTSVPYNRVNAVSFVSDKSFLGKFASTSEIAVSAGGNVHTVQFRGEEKGKLIHDTILSYMLGTSD